MDTKSTLGASENSSRIFRSPEAGTKVQNQVPSKKTIQIYPGKWTPKDTSFQRVKRSYKFDLDNDLDYEYD